MYFVAHTGNQSAQARTKVRVKGTHAEWWDPFSGAKEPANWTGGVLALDLAPYESRVLVITNGPAASVAPARNERGRLDIGSDWKVTFTGLGESVRMAKLKSWAEAENTRYYSGQAVYEKTVDVPASLVGSRVILSFGAGTPATADGRSMGYRALLESPVREAAVVEVNGQRAGSVWKPPYELDITKLLKPGPNTFRITAGNLAINLLAGQKLPNYRLLNIRYGERFTPQDMNNLQPLPSGILGPLTLIAR